MQQKKGKGKGRWEDRHVDGFIHSHLEVGKFREESSGGRYDGIDPAELELLEVLHPLQAREVQFVVHILAGGRDDGEGAQAREGGEGVEHVPDNLQWS